MILRALWSIIVTLALITGMALVIGSIGDKPDHRKIGTMMEEYERSRTIDSARRD